MRLFAVGLLFGIISLQQFRHLPNVHWAWLFVLAFLLPWRQPMFRTFAAAIIGFCWATVFSTWRLDNRLEESFEVQQIRIQGRVVGLPVTRSDHIQFYLRPFSMQVVHGSGSAVALSKLPGKIKLSWYQFSDKLQAGEIIDVKVKLKRPNGFMNSGGFDYETWLFTRGVDAVGYVQKRYPQPDNSHVIALRLTVSEVVDTWRQRLLNKLQNCVDDLPNAGLIIALVLGERFAVTGEQWRLFQNSGTNHLLAISGLHIGFVAAMVFFISRRLWSCLALANNIPAQRAAALPALLAALTYAALAGFSIPTQRALIMVLLLLIAHWRRSATASSHSLACAAVVVLVINPLSVLDAGFWLSFIAVASLMYSLSPQRRQQSIYRRWVVPQLAVFFGLGWFILKQYGQLPLLSPVANIVAIPWVSFVTVPLCLVAAPLLWLAPALARGLLYLADASLSLLQHFLTWLDRLQWQLQIFSIEAVWPWLFALLGVLLLMLPNRMPLRLLALGLCAPLFFTAREEPATGQFTVTFLDVGQGLAIMVATRQHLLLYDSGPRYSKNFDAANAVILPWLRHSGYTRLDKLILSHHDSDHIGATLTLVKNYTVDQISTTWLEKYQVTTNSCQENQHWNWDGVDFTVLHPAADFPGGESDNNHSCVIKISNDKQRVLLTGDIERKVEQSLIQRYPGEELKSDVLLVPHHGSKSSSSPEFIDKVSPRWAIASTGYRNRFGFPKSEIVERYLQRGIAFLSTSHYGALTFLFDGVTEPQLRQAYRVDKSRYWHRDVTAE